MMSAPHCEECFKTLPKERKDILLEKFKSLMISRFKAEDNIPSSSSDDANNETFTDWLEVAMGSIKREYCKHIQ